MTRLFVALASIDGVMLLVSFVLGVLSKLRDGIHHPDDATYWYHFLLGLTTAIVNLLVHCVIFVYFLGTGRWVKEVKLAYHLADEPLPKLTRDLKRRVFPPALFAMLTAIATGAAGAAAHVGLSRWEIHFTLALITLAVNVWAFRVEYQCLATNSGILVQVMNQVEEIRASRGLPTSQDALSQEQA